MDQTGPSLSTIPATSILAGLGSLNRDEICSLLAILEEIDGISVAKGALEDLGKRLRILGEVSAGSIDEAKQRLLRTPPSD